MEILNHVELDILLADDNFGRVLNWRSKNALHNAFVWETTVEGSHYWTLRFFGKAKWTKKARDSILKQIGQTSSSEPEEDIWI